MYGCIESYVVYGWRDTDTNRVINDEWLDERGVRAFAEELIRFHSTNAIYGEHCTLNSKTGQAEVDDETKQNVEKAYIECSAYYSSNGETIPNLGFYTVVSGSSGDVINWGEMEKYDPTTE